MRKLIALLFVVGIVGVTIPLATPGVLCGSSVSCLD